MIVGSLVLILSAAGLLVGGLVLNSDWLLGASIVASLFAAVVLYIGARQSASARAQRRLDAHDEWDAGADDEPLAGRADDRHSPDDFRSYRQEPEYAGADGYPPPEPYHSAEPAEARGDYHRTEAFDRPAGYDGQDGYDAHDGYGAQGYDQQDGYQSPDGYGQPDSFDEPRGFDEQAHLEKQGRFDDLRQGYDAQTRYQGGEPGYGDDAPEEPGFDDRPAFEEQPPAPAWEPTERLPLQRDPDLAEPDEAAIADVPTGEYHTVPPAVSEPIAAEHRMDREPGPEVAHQTPEPQLPEAHPAAPHEERYPGRAGAHAQPEPEPGLAPEPASDNWVGGGTDEEDPKDEPPIQRRPVSVAAAVARLDVDVFVIDGRPRYHVPGCVHLLGRETEPLPAYEAVDLGFTPCSLCEPDMILTSGQTARH